MRNILTLIFVAALTIIAVETNAYTKQVEGGSISFGPPTKKFDPKDWDFLPEVVATFGDEKITKKQVLDIIKKEKQKSMSLPMKRELVTKTADQLFARDVLLKKAEKAGFKPSSDLVAQRMKAMFEKLPEAQKKALETKWKATGESLDKYIVSLSKQKEVQDDAAIKAWLEKDVKPSIKVTSDEIKKFHTDNTNRFSKPIKVRASHILIKPKDKTPASKQEARKKAEALLAQIKKGEDFGELAKKESECPSKSKKGDLNWFGKGQMVKPFEKTAFSMEPGQISDVVETQFGYHIIKLTDKQKPEIIPLEKVQDRIKSYLEQIKENEAIEKIVKAEKAKTKFTVKLKK